MRNRGIIRIVKQNYVGLSCKSTETDDIFMHMVLTISNLQENTNYVYLYVTMQNAIHVPVERNWKTASLCCEERVSSPEGLSNSATLKFFLELSFLF